MDPNILTHVAKINLKDNQLPEWIKLFDEGWVEIAGGGMFLVDREAFDLLQAYLTRRGVDIVFDYEHQSLTTAKAPAAGWIKEWRYRDGVEVRVDWTDAARTHITKKEYRYFSPVSYSRDNDKRLIAVHSVALTNTPKTNRLQPIVAKLALELDGKEQTEMGLLQVLIAKLGLTDTAGDEEVVAAVAKLKEKAPESVEVVSQDVLAALDLDEGESVSTVVASIHAMKQTTKNAVSRVEFEQLQNDLIARDATAIVAKAMAAGKVTPDQKDWATEYAKKDLDGFKVYVAKAPVVIPVADLPGKKQTADELIADEATLDVAKMMGNDPEDLKKYAV